MTITVDDFIKLIVALAIVFSIVGISWQFIRILGEMVSTVKESNLIIRDGRELIEKVVDDYDYLSEQVKFILESVSGLVKAIVVPLTNIFSFLKKIEDLPIFGRSKTKTKKSEKKEPKKRSGII
jgi:hypothetical protein